MKCSDIPGDPALYSKSKLRYLAEHIATAQGWELSDDCYALQFNYQHTTSFPPHIDSPGPLKDNLFGGDGFGDQIAILQLRGSESWTCASVQSSTLHWG